MTAKSKPMVIVAGSLFWPLVIAGAVTENNALVFLALALFVGTMTVVGIGAWKAAKVRQVRDERLRADGLPGRATVVSIDDRGGTINNDPIVHFELDVAVGATPPYRAQTSMRVSRLDIPRIQPGCELDVRVDPTDRDTVLIDL